MTQHPGPLSLAQEGLWFLDRLTPRSAAYNLVTGARFGGLLDAAALGRALDAIVQRHEVLRTHVEVLDGRPVQRVRSGVGSGLIVDDLADLSTSEWERAADQITAEDLARPFDLETGPLLRARLLRLDQRRHRLIVVMHHIVTDGTSMGVFWDELSALYGAHIGGRSAPEPRLPNLPLQYLDYAAWQRERLDRGEYNAGLAYWRSALSGAPSVLDLPLDRPIPATRSFAAAAHRWTLRADIVDKLGHLCAREGATRFMGLLAAFAVVLGRYADRDDLLIGCPVSGRTRTELEGLIGLFANTLPLRIDLSGASFRELLGRVRTTALGGYTHQDVPFELLVSELAPPRSPQQHPLVQVMAVLHQAPLGTPRLAGLTAEPVALRARTAKADLSLLIRGTAGDLEASLEYDAEIFEPGTVRRLAVRLERLIKIIVAEPDRPVHKIDLRSPAERRATAQWNRTRVPSQNRWLHETVAAKAAAEPDAVAVRHGDRVLTYGDLDRRANRLAHRLVAGGAGRGTVLAVCMTRSPSLVIAFLAILKTGATYLPLDPALPAKRLHWMLADARATLLLGGTDVADRLPAYGCSVVTEEDQEDGSDGEKSRPLQTRDTNEPDPLEQAPITQLTPEDTAYIIYTSGSTGTPKGVALPQRGLRNVVEAQAKVFGITPTDRVLQFASPGFDAAIFEMALALGAGAQLCLIDADVAVPGPALLEVLRRQEITYVTLPPSVLALLPEGDLPHLHTVSVAGEPCRSPLVRRWARGRRMFNLYGPTEATIWSTFAACDPDALTAADPPIGRPIGNTTVQVVDQDLRPVPIGTPGELLIGGPGVATGYLNQPELTAEKFLPDPANPRHRLYRTGDLVRWRPDGNLTYHGRLDRQLKIRGYRIEPGEIETALTRHPAIRHAHVTTHKPHHAAAAAESDDQRLIAYLVAAGGTERPDGRRLREYLAPRLPDHLIPSRFVFIDRIPLTPNAKIDEAALRRLDTIKVDPDPSPCTRTEQKVAEIWAELLRLPRLGRTEDFFVLGGDSLLAVRVLARVAGTFGVNIPLRRLFDNPTVAGLSTEIDAHRNESVVLNASPDTRTTRKDLPHPLTSGQQGLWFLNQLTPGSAAYHVPVAVRLIGPLQIGAFERAFAELIRRHEPLRTRIVQGPSGPLAVPDPAASVPLVVTDLTRSPLDRDGAIRTILAAETARPFDLAVAPPLRVLLLRLNAQTHILLVVMHHIAIDSRSIQVFWDELSTLYRAASEDGRPAAGQVLPPLPARYGDIATAQRDWLAGPDGAAQRAFWMRALAGAPAVIDLPVDRPEPPSRSGQGARCSFELPPDLVRGLVALGAECHATLFMVLLGAFDMLLWRYCRQQDIVVGTPVAGRTQPGVSDLIGYFVNTLVIRLDMSGSPSFRTLLGRARDTVLDAYQHQELPFDRLVAELAPERRGARNPLFQVLLVVHPSAPPVPRLPGVEANPVDVPRGSAKFDLALSVQPGTSPDTHWLGTMEYDTDLFERDTVQRLVDRFRLLLREILAGPDRSIGDLVGLDGAERRQLAAWTAPRAEPGRRRVQELIAEATARTPDRIALELGADRLTYRDLNSRANRLANYLRACHVEPGTLVGVYLDRTAELVISLLAVLRAGGAFVPIDTVLPPPLLAHMLSDTSAPVILTRRRLADRLPRQGALVIEVDTEGPKISAAPASRPDSVGTAHDPAYVIYTSGSTGRPKGVMISHAALSHLVHSLRDRPGFRPEDVVFSVTSHCFDVFHAELFGALSVGSTLVLAGEDVLLDGRAMADHISKHAVTLMHATPGIWRLLVDAGWPGRKGLRAISTGEKLPSMLASQLAARADEVWNLYGPTETTVYATAHRLVEPHDPMVPIGRPIGNTTVQVVDQDLRPVPIGTPGELLIGGPGVATGYLNQPELTAEKFLPDPANPRHRLYRTGDLVRWRPDGNLTYHGRLDRQFKIRGYRIEPGEIETALTRHPAIRHAHVTTHKPHHAAAPQLTAYVMPTDTHARPSPAELRHLLAGEVAPHLIPSRFVFVDRIPLTPNAKIDEAALLRLDAVNPAPAPAWAPRTAPERLLARLWMEVVGLERLTHHGDFFSQGGDSLRAVALLARVRDATGIELGVRAFLQRPSLAGLVEQLCLAALRTLPEQTAGRLLDQIEQLQDDGIEEQ